MGGGGLGHLPLSGRMSSRGPIKDINPNSPLADKQARCPAHGEVIGFLCSSKHNSEIPAVVLEGLMEKLGCIFFLNVKMKHYRGSRCGP